MSCYADAYMVWRWECPACGHENQMGCKRDWDECAHCGKTITLSCRDGEDW